MKEITYGYVRVSTHMQNEARQLAAMREFGVAEENIVTERLSGKDFNRPLYQDLVKKLQTEDVLVVKSIDRLGEITMRSWSNGHTSPKSAKRPLWYWICPCWTPGRGVTSRGR